VKLFDFFPRWILIRLTSNLWRFVSNSVQILTWNFKKKLFRDKFCEKPRLSSSKICEISPYFMQFYSVLKNCVEKFTQVLSCVVCTLRRRHVHKQITKRRYRKEKPEHFVFGKPVLFALGVGVTTPYSLGLLVWKFYQTFVIVCIEFWLRFEPQIHPTRFSKKIWFITARVEMKVRLCVKLFDFFPMLILIRLTWNLWRFVPNSVQILTWNFRKKLFRDKFCEKPRLSSSKICEISPYFLQFYSVLKNCFEKFTQVLSCAFCTLRRRHIHKQITKTRYREEKPGHFVFGKPILFALGVGVTMPYSLGLLVWKFYQRFVIVCIVFWLRFLPQIRITRFSTNFFFIIARVERKVLLCVKLFDFFPRWILIRLTWNLWRFVPNSIQILTWNFKNKIFWDKFCEKPTLAKFVKFRPTICNFIMCWEIALKNSHKYFHVLFAPCEGCTFINKSQKRDIGKKSQDILFSENRFCSLSVWVLLRPIPWVFWSEIFTGHSSLCVLSFGWDLSPSFLGLLHVILIFCLFFIC